MILNQRELKRRMLLRLKGIESGRPLIGPATMHLRLTDLCNLACQYCWYYGPNSTLRPTGKNHFPYETFESIVDDCLDLQVDKINLSGIGDPSLHPRFYDMLERLQHSFAVTIFTNGTFPIDRCRDILRADHIVINLGEADRQSYKALQGRDLFIKVIKNIRELTRLRSQFNPNFCIEVVFVETKLNAQSLLKTENLMRKLGVDKVQKKVFEVSDHNHHIMLTDDNENEEISEGWSPCFHGWFYSAIRLNGDVNVCSFTKRLTIGNVLKNSFKEIWESKEYSRARNSALKGLNPFKNYQECINCRVAWRNKEIASQMDMFNRMQKV